MKSEDVTASLRKAVENHQPDAAWLQWYSDELVIDCDAGEFWAVIEKALAKLISSEASSLCAEYSVGKLTVDADGIAFVPSEGGDRG